MKKNAFGFLVIASSIICLGVFLYLNTSDNNIVFMQKRDESSKNLDQKSKELLETIRNRNLVTDDPKKLAEAIQAIGERQIVEAIPDLIEYLNFRRIHEWEGTGVMMHPLPVEGDYPAVGALFSIGKPALPALVKVIQEKETETTESKNAVRTIQLIFRDDLSDGVKFLEDETAKRTDTESKRRLQCAVDKTKAELLKIQNMKTN